MGQKPGERTEENEQDRGRHSNLPFDETEIPGGSKRSRARENSRARSLRFPDRETFRPAGLLASGSSADGLLPGRATFRSDASSGLLPGASPVTVAGAARALHPPPCGGPERDRTT